MYLILLAKFRYKIMPLPIPQQRCERNDKKLFKFKIWSKEDIFTENPLTTEPDRWNYQKLLFLSAIYVTFSK